MVELALIGGTIAFGGFAIWLAMRAAAARGAADERAAHTRDALNEIRKANEAMASVDDLSAESRRKRMSAWSRD